MEAFRQRMQKMNEKRLFFLPHGEQGESSTDSSETSETTSTSGDAGAPEEASASFNRRPVSSESPHQVVDAAQEETVRSLVGKRQLSSSPSETPDHKTRLVSKTTNSQASEASLRRPSMTSLEEKSVTGGNNGNPDMGTARAGHIDAGQKKGVEAEVSSKANEDGNSEESDSDSSIVFLLEETPPSHVSKSPPAKSFRSARETTPTKAQQGFSSDAARRLSRSREFSTGSLDSLQKPKTDRPRQMVKRPASVANRGAAPHAPSVRTNSRSSSTSRRAPSRPQTSSAVRSTGSSPLSASRRVPPNHSSANSYSRSSARSYDRPSPHSSRAQTPLRRPAGRRGELLGRIEDEMATMRDEMLVRNLEVESAMLRDPFARLYHMNNRRDRDERRGRIQQYRHLEAMKERLLVDSDSDGARHRQARREVVAREREELFSRLSQPSPKRTSRSVTPTSTHGRRTPTADDATFQRLYEDGVGMRAARAERQRRWTEEREQREVKEMLRARILARVELKSPQYARSPQQLEERVTAIERSLTNDPQKLREFLSPRQMSKEEEKSAAWRLSHHGYLNADKLAERKAKEELKQCTFHPWTNPVPNVSSRYASKNLYARDTCASSARRLPETPSTTSTKRSSSNTQKRACESLYLRAAKQRKNREELVAMAEQEKRLSFLKSKLREDHHFCRRVELDPSLAERFMASLVI